MKKVMLFFALTLLAVSACKKEDDDGAGPTPNIDDPAKIRYFEYKEDGLVVRRDSILNDTLYSISGNSIFIDLRNDAKRLLLYIQPFDGEQEYFDTYIQREDNGFICADTSGGFVNIYNIDLDNNYIEGSFSGYCDNTGEKDITEGVFLIDYFE